MGSSSKRILVCFTMVCLRCRSHSNSTSTCTRTSHICCRCSRVVHDLHLTCSLRSGWFLGKEQDLDFFSAQFLFARASNMAASSIATRSLLALPPLPPPQKKTPAATQATLPAIVLKLILSFFFIYLFPINTSCAVHYSGRREPSWGFDFGFFFLVFGSVKGWCACVTACQK